MSLFGLTIQDVTSSFQSFSKFVSKPYLCGVFLDLEQCSCSGESQVSTQMLVTTDGKRTYINDNIAPGPRMWNLKGYILPYDAGIIDGMIDNASRDLSTLSLAKTVSAFIPAASSIAGSLSFMKFSEDILWRAYLNKNPVSFRDKDGRVWSSNLNKPVAIERLTITDDPAIQNRKVIEATIKELRILNSFDNAINFSAFPTPDGFNIDNLSDSIGTFTATAVTDPLSLFGGNQ